MKKISNFKMLKYFFIIMASFFFCLPAEAYENAKSIQVSPTRFDYKLGPSAKTEGTLKLKNFAKDEYKVKVYAEDFYVEDYTSDAKFFVPDNAHPLLKYDIIKWIKIDEENFRMAPDEAKEIHFKIDVPEGLPTGGYYGVIFVEHEEPGSEENAVMVKSRVGVLLSFAVQGKEPIKQDAELKDFRATKKIFWDNPAGLIADVYSSGNMHFKMSGQIDIYNLGIFKKDPIVLKDQFQYPGKIRRYEEMWKFAPWWGYGYYTARINLVSEDGKIVLSKDANFWVIPWKTTVIILGTLFLLWLIRKIFKHNFELRRKKKGSL